jgi:hypothetical protein
LSFQKAIGSSFLNISELENHQFQFFEKNQNQSTVGPGYFKTLKEPVVFMKTPVKNGQFSI